MSEIREKIEKVRKVCRWDWMCTECPEEKTCESLGMGDEVLPMYWTDQDADRIEKIITERGEKANED